MRYILIDIRWESVFYAHAACTSEVFLFEVNKKYFIILHASSFNIDWTTLIDKIYW